MNEIPIPREKLLRLVPSTKHDPPAGYRWLWSSRPDIDEPGYLDAVQATVRQLRRLRPWTLIEIPGDPAPLVAERLTLWWRARTWWLNRQRRIDADRRRHEMLHYFGAEQEAARHKAAQ